MAYDLHDEKGFVGGGPSINGLRVLKASLQHISPAVYPQMASLMKYGYANSPLRLKYETMALVKGVKDIGAKSTLVQIGKVAAKARTIVILHAHTN